MSQVDVVVIDDDEAVRWVLRELLDLQGIRTGIAQSGAEGLALIREYQPRVALVDLRLGAMTGLDVARKMQCLSPETKIVFLTGFPDALRAQNIGDLPVVAVLAKPFDVSELEATVNRALDEHKSGLLEKR